MNIYMFIAGAAFALTSAGTGYYILKNHPEHFKRTIFDVSFSAYSTIKSTTSTLYNTFNNVVYGATNKAEEPTEPKFKIVDLKLLHSDMIIDLPVSLYGVESTLKPGSLLHVCYIYNDVTYRVVFNYGQDLTILTTNTQWVDEGFRNGIDFIESTTSLDNDELWGIMHQYAGPLSDFYNEARHIQNYKGFLNEHMTVKLIDDSASQVIKVTNILGETKSFPLELKTIENSSFTTSGMFTNGEMIDKSSYTMINPLHNSYPKEEEGLENESNEVTDPQLIEDEDEINNSKFF